MQCNLLQHLYAVKSRLLTEAVFCRYDPYGRVLTREEYDQEGMRSVRRRFVQQASRAQQWGVVLGTLGRQGNPRILTHLQSLLTSRSLSYTTVSSCSCCVPHAYFHVSICYMLCLHATPPQKFVMCTVDIYLSLTPCHKTFDCSSCSVYGGLLPGQKIVS